MKRSFYSASMCWLASSIQAPLLGLGLGLFSAACGGSSSSVDEPPVVDYPVAYPGGDTIGSTHEITYNPKVETPSG